MNIKTEKQQFIKDGQPFFPISGEIHYFRISADKWEEHLRRLKETGANTTSTYICWDWHEYEEGKFDFSGETHPSRNIIGYIELCKKVGLNLMVKPGPYILAEYIHHGLPAWLLKKCGKEAYAQNPKSEIIMPDLMCYMSEEFLKYTFLWYDQIMPIIAAHQAKNGGPIVMMQVCNEVGIFQWLSGEFDCNKAVIRLYKQFISDKYGTVRNLNQVYGTDYKDLQEVQPPTGVIENRQDYCAYYDFHLFYRHYFAVYFDTLIQRIKGYGIDLQFTHNIPGWIYGGASELPMLISTYAEIMETRSDVTFGLDHIPEYVSYRNAHADLGCNKILEAVQPNGPVWSAEFQAGTREYNAKSYANDMRTFYYASLAHSMKGFNYYMFSQGKNPPGKGYYGSMFYYQNALDYQGEKLPLYEVIKEINGFINQEQDNLLLSETTADICIGLYKPYFYTELTTSQMLRQKRLDVGKVGLRVDPRFIREEVLFNGLLRGLQTANYNYDIKDLEKCDPQALLKYKQLWLTATEFMSESVQALLVSYVKNGGHLIIYPVIPTLDNYLNPCTVLKDSFGLEFHWEKSPNKVEIMGIQEFYTYTEDKQVYQESGGEIIARTENGSGCGIRKKLGEGMVTALGLTFGFIADEQYELLEKLVKSDQIAKDAWVSDPDVQFVLRKGPRYSYLFLLNYHNEKKTFAVDHQQCTLEPFSCKVMKVDKVN
jgi:Beta-galactosidase